MRLLRRGTPPIRDASGRPVPGSIAALELPTIGGTPQGVLVRGRSAANPGLLILHGGPGGAYIAAARSFFGFLEREWVVVNWDMRGAGLSYSKQVTPASLTGTQLGNDAAEVRTWVTERFGVRRWVLLAHSFGSYVAPFVLEREPAAFEAYVAVAPAPTDVLAEKESYDWTVRAARVAQNRRAEAALERIGPPPYAAETGALSVRARWTDRLGGAVKGTQGSAVAFRAARAGTEYSWLDIFRRYLPGERFWMQHADRVLGSASSTEGSAESPVPVVVMAGTDDWMVPLAACERTLVRYRAPAKSLVRLDGMGHYPFVENPSRFAGVLEPLRTAALRSPP